MFTKSSKFYFFLGFEFNVNVVVYTLNSLLNVTKIVFKKDLILKENS